MPTERPAVAFVDHRTLEEMACGRPCAVYGWFPPGETVYLDERLDPVADVAARGILVHELVHYLQQESGAFGAARDCRIWSRREHEAFDIQLRWLAERGGARRALPGYARGALHVSCEEPERPPPG